MITTSTAILKRKAIRSSEVVDCGTTECFLETQLVQNCIYYLHTNNSNCDIPCKLEGCKTELHHFIMCPIWTCEDKSTTTSTTSTSTSSTKTTTKTTTIATTTLSTTTPMTTLSTTTPESVMPFTLGPLPPIDHPAYLYLSNHHCLSIWLR